MERRSASLATDEAMVRFLEERDGPMATQSVPHSAFGTCRYAELYAGAVCPWCEAESKRREREAASGSNRP